MKSPVPKSDASFILPHGGYEKLLSYQKAIIIFDGTQYFTKRFFSKYDRTIDQMVQAARSGKQNIVEASMAAATSKETEIKLTNVARASLFELKEDYQDFLRINGYQQWSIDYRLMNRFRVINRTPDANYETYRKAIENENPEICANTMICLINIVTYLLWQQIKTIEEGFLNNGGLRERMTKARIDRRKNDFKK